MGQTDEDVATLHEGVPSWARTPVWRWIGEVLSTPVPGGGGGSGWRTSWLEDFEMILALPKALSPSEDIDDLEWAVTTYYRDEVDQILVHLLDFLVMKTGGLAERRDISRQAISGYRHRLHDLDRILRTARFAWVVGSRDGNAGLERRVPEGVQVAADFVMTRTTHAGDILSEAWHAAFGVSPDPSKAYDRALKAVEAAMKKPVLPDDKTATLTKMKNTVRGQKNWSLPMEHEDAVTPSSLVLLGMIQTLIAGQPDRHASDGPLPKVSQEAAETAVMLAVPLVHWFSSGAASRR